MISVRHSTRVEQVVERRLDRREFVPGFSGELRVGFEHLNREGDLVNDALAGAVAAGEKLKVLIAIIGFHAINMVNCLFFSETPTDAFFHDVAVLKNFSGRLAKVSLNNEAHVAVSSGATFVGSPNLKSPLFGFLKFRSAQRAANPIDSPESSVGSSLRGYLFSALNAHGRIFGLRIGFSANGGTRDGAVERVFTPLLSVRPKMPRFEEKGLAAVFAGKFYLRYFSIGAPVGREIVEVALTAAEAVRFSFVLYLEQFSALFAGAVARHVTPMLVLSSEYTYSELLASRISGAL